jgi:DNA-binding transcriptional ArsR family regulator
MADSADEGPVTAINDPRYVRALAHPLRIRLLAMLRERRASPMELSSRLGEPIGNVAYHVRTLHNLGLIKLVDTRQRRGATEHYYEALENPRFSDDAWDALGPVAKQRMLSAMLRQAGEYAAGSAANGGFDRKDAVINRSSLRLDERGWAELARACKRWLAEMDQIEAAAGERLGDNAEGEALDVGLILMLFEALPLSDQPRSGSSQARSGSASPSRKRSPQSG